MTEANTVAAATNGETPPFGEDPNYWHSLLPEPEAADFLDVTPRALQDWRQRGTGPPYVRISARCIKYTRFRMKCWYDARVRSSTSDPGTA